MSRTQSIGAAPDAIKMQRVVNFYSKLPRGPAPVEAPKGILGRYQAKHFSGKNASAKRMLPVCCCFAGRRTSGILTRAM